ncbi:SulP family inorganic anion transporter [Flavobacterium agricola]|uniref:SulP family inorganic anion transporter n=1 Tax=Flavobacterium agricola TaxID=2870839 RepID=A0ABY6M1B3_9FLAO|nr:SulP family inorganic anion transporter [Flavobacterium agricola]UYW01500.1 SulP family inorganic anion transporter [Flavobacterium agricola]
MLQKLKHGWGNINYKVEILAGLTVAMTMIPESLSFAILANLNPLNGLYAAFIMGLVTALFGGRPAMISGGAGATVIVLIALVQTHGVEYLFVTVILAGIFQLLVGVFKLGKFIRLVPESVMYGFVNGLAVVIFLSQLKQFKTIQAGQEVWMQGPELYKMLALTGLTVVIVFLFPKITKKIPASLVGIVVVFALVAALGIETRTVKDIATIAGTLPPFHIPMVPFSLETLQVIFPYALVMAGVGLIETLLTLTVVDEMTETRGDSNQECLAQGSANILNGFFTGMGGCAMIAQTFVNIDAGSRTRLAGVIGAFAILLIILVGAPFIEMVPMAALTGVMMVVAFLTFKWSSFKFIHKMPKSDTIVMLVVMAITIFMHNLALAVLAGVIISALVFAWESAVRIRARKYVANDGIKYYEIYGPLFFASVSHFIEKFDVDADPENVVVSFKESRIADVSGIEALNKLAEKYRAKDKKIVLTHLSADCIQLLKNADVLVKVDINTDPTYKIPYNVQ